MFFSMAGRAFRAGTIREDETQTQTGEAEDQVSSFRFPVVGFHAGGKSPDWVSSATYAWISLSRIPVMSSHGIPAASSSHIYRDGLCCLADDLGCSDYGKHRTLIGAKLVEGTAGNELASLGGSLENVVKVYARVAPVTQAASASARIRSRSLRATQILISFRR